MTWPRTPIALLAGLVLFALPLQAGNPDPKATQETGVTGPTEKTTPPLRIGNIVIANREYDWKDWAKEAYWTLHRSTLGALLDSLEAQPSKEARREPSSRTAKVEFTVNRKGRVSDVQLRLAFVHRVLDQAVLDAAQDAKLPPLPPDFPEKRVSLIATFVLSGKLDAAVLERLREMRKEGFCRDPVQSDDWCHPSGAPKPD